MALEVWREFLGSYELVGSFTDGAPRERLFAYADSYLSSGHAHAIASSLPLRHEAYKEGEYSAAFGGMVPEGSARIELSQRFQIASSDYLSLLERLGDECIGALRFRASELSETESYRPLTTADEKLLVRNGPGFAISSMQESRLSLTGAQSKTGLYLKMGSNPADAPIDAWLLPMGSAPSTHILKVASEDATLLASNEYVCMDCARACGLAVAESWVSKTLPRTFISKRFDRSWSDDNRIIDGLPAPLRLHQEDFCQALGWEDYSKYEVDPMSCYARICGELIRRTSFDALSDVRSFARQVAFDYVIGNCDSHLKNHSFLYSPDWSARRLAPAYDIVCTTVLGYDHNLGMSIGDHRRIEEVCPEDFSLFAGDMQAVRRLFIEDCSRIVEELPDALRKFQDWDGLLSEVASAILDDIQPRLLVLRDFCMRRV